MLDMSCQFNSMSLVEYLTHTYEGPDDMPGHVKSSLIGTDLVIPTTTVRSYACYCECHCDLACIADRGVGCIKQSSYLPC
jgi:hypothetical protein